MSRNDMRVGLILFVLLSASWSCAGAQEFVYDHQGKRNPFIPIVTPDGRYQKLEPDLTERDTELRLEGIIYDKYGISYAVVDGTVVKTGDMIGDGYQVLKIEERVVIFMREGQEKTVELKKEGA